MRPKSIKPKKQRKYNFTAPKNEAHKLVSAMLSPDLRAAKGFRTLPVREGDTVTIMRGAFKGKSGKVTKVIPSKQRLHIQKITRGKTDKTEIPVPIHPSNVMITKYVTKKDDFRKRLIKRRVKDESIKDDLDAEFAILDAEEDEVEEIELDDDISEEDDEEIVDESDDLELVEEDEE